MPNTTPFAPVVFTGESRPAFPDGTIVNQHREGNDRNAWISYAYPGGRPQMAARFFWLAERGSRLSPDELLELRDTACWAPWTIKEPMTFEEWQTL